MRIIRSEINIFIEIRIRFYIHIQETIYENGKLLADSRAVTRIVDCTYKNIKPRF